MATRKSTKKISVNRDDLSPAQKAALTKAERYGHKARFLDPEEKRVLTPTEMHDKLSDAARRAWVTIRSKAKAKGKTTKAKATREPKVAVPEMPIVDLTVNEIADMTDEAISDAS